MAPKDMLHTQTHTHILILMQRARKRKNHLNCGTVASSASVIVVVVANRFTASCVGVGNEPFNVCMCVCMGVCVVHICMLYLREFIVYFMAYK